MMNITNIYQTIDPISFDNNVIAKLDTNEVVQFTLNADTKIVLDLIEWPWTVSKETVNAIPYDTDIDTIKFFDDNTHNVDNGGLTILVDTNNYMKYLKSHNVPVTKIYGQQGKLSEAKSRVIENLDDSWKLFDGNHVYIYAILGIRYIHPSTSLPTIAYKIRYHT